MTADAGTIEPAVVLIAEDEEPIAELLAYVVTDAGHTPLVAPHGRAALELARARLPALLFTDLMMPFLGGAELIAALRAAAAAAGHAPPIVVLVTAAGARQALAAGADVVVYKPFEVAEIDALLHRFLDAPAAAPSPDGLDGRHPPPVASDPAAPPLARALGEPLPE